MVAMRIKGVPRPASQGGRSRTGRCWPSCVAAWSQRCSQSVRRCGPCQRLASGPALASEAGSPRDPPSRRRVGQPHSPASGPATLARKRPPASGQARTQNGYGLCFVHLTPAAILVHEQLTQRRKHCCYRSSLAILTSAALFFFVALSLSAC